MEVERKGKFQVLKIIFTLRGFQHGPSWVQIEAQLIPPTSRTGKDTNNLMVYTWVGLELKRHYTPNQHDTIAAIHATIPLPTQPLISNLINVMITWWMAHGIFLVLDFVVMMFSQEAELNMIWLLQHNIYLQFYIHIHILKNWNYNADNNRNYWKENSSTSCSLSVSKRKKIKWFISFSFDVYELEVFHKNE